MAPYSSSIWYNASFFFLYFWFFSFSSGNLIFLSQKDLRHSLLTDVCPVKMCLNKTWKLLEKESEIIYKTIQEEHGRKKWKKEGEWKIHKISLKKRNEKKAKMKEKERKIERKYKTIR